MTNVSTTLSYLGLRKAVGLLGVSLPFILAVGGLLFGAGLQGSMSAYYYTNLRAIFIGNLWATGSFLFSYRGYELADEIAAKVASISAIGISLFPTTLPPPAIPSSTAMLVENVHAACTAVFFLTLSYFALVLFTKTDPTQTPTPKKLQRNTVYRVCGYTIIVCILLILAHNLLPSTAMAGIEAYKPVFVLETFAVLAFGSSWLVKGETILKDDV